MIIFLLWVICVAVAAYFVKIYRRSGWWVVFTALFPISLLLLLIAGRKMGIGGYKRCLNCEELISYFANTCPHCRSEQYAENQNSGQVFATVICPKCKSVNTSDIDKCYNCGKIIE